MAGDVSKLLIIYSSIYLQCSFEIVEVIQSTSECSLNKYNTSHVTY